MGATGRVPCRQARGVPDLTGTSRRSTRRRAAEAHHPSRLARGMLAVQTGSSGRPSRAITERLRSEIDPIAVGCNPRGRMKSLSIEARTAETAQGLRSALADFEPEVIEQDPKTFVVRVDLSPYGGSDIGSVLSAIQRYIASCQARSALIELDGRTYMIEAR